MIELKRAEYREILRYLRSEFPSTVPSFNAVKIACDYDLKLFPPLEHLFVDKWPHPQCHVSLAPVFDTDESVSLTWHIDLSTSGSTSLKMLRCLKDLDHQLDLRHIRFQSFASSEHLRLFETYFEPFGLCTSLHQLPFNLVIIPAQKIPDLIATNITPPPGYTFDRLHPDEAEFVDSLWKFRKPGSVDCNRERIATLPSVCLRNSQGLPVSFVMTHQIGVFNHAFTLPEYRGLGLITYVSRRLAQIHALMGLYPCAFVEEGNDASLKVFTERLGFVKTNVEFFWFRYDPKKETDV